MTGIHHERAPLDWRAKGLPGIDGTMEVDQVAKAGWNLFDGRFLLPTMIIRRDALEHDIGMLARWADDAGVSLAPHGKTTMSPQIWRHQLDAGAWAMTVATPWQARVAATVGVPRILVANQIVDQGGLAWVNDVLDRDEPEVITQVDSTAGVERLQVAASRSTHRLKVLLEVGVQGGRTGVRTAQEARTVLQAIVDSPSLIIAGVTCFEGIVTGGSRETRNERVRDFLAFMREVAAFVAPAAAAQGSSELILSGGGSIHFLTVAEELSRPIGTDLPVRVVIRSGCTVTHDHVGYDADSPWGSAAPTGEPRLRPALEVWAPVLSTPEPGLALAGAGRRDLPYDIAMPVVIGVRRSDGANADARGMMVTNLNDQHAFLSLAPGAELAVGDLVAFGIAHPCSAFDRWRWIPVVDQAYDVIDVYETLF